MSRHEPYTESDDDFIRRSRAAPKPVPWSRIALYLGGRAPTAVREHAMAMGLLSGVKSKAAYREQYRAPEADPPRRPAPRPLPVRDDWFIAPPSLARLMAGR